MTLETTINIGPALADDLRAAGIADADELRALGATNAWERIGAVRPDSACVHALLALEGAVRGVRWMQLPKDDRASLSAWARARGAA